MCIADSAVQIIQTSIRRVGSSVSPDTAAARAAGEIDMAYKLGFVTFEERDSMLGVLAMAVSSRRYELNRAQRTNIIGPAA